MPKASARRKPVTRRSGPPVSGMLARMHALKSSFGKLGGQAVEFILANANEVVGMSLTELAERTGVSESMIIKICQQLGVSGLQQLKISLAQDLVEPVQFIHEDLARRDDAATVTEKIFHANIAALQDTLKILKSESMARAVEIIHEAERIELYGIGSAAPIAEDVHYRMMRIGLVTRFHPDAHLQIVSASLGGPDVAVIAVSHSGSTIETVQALQKAKEAGSKTILITGFRKSTGQQYADVVLQTMARETKFRTEAMSSRIAQLSIADALVANLALLRHDRAVETLQRTFDVLSLRRL
jgi:DNA-binding MurR/RpiR family transcriptional regulator